MWENKLHKPNLMVLFYRNKRKFDPSVFQLFLRPKTKNSKIFEDFHCNSNRLEHWPTSCTKGWSCFIIALLLHGAMVIFASEYASAWVCSKYSLYLSRKVIDCIVTTWVGFTPSHKLYNLLPHLARLNFGQQWPSFNPNSTSYSDSHTYWSKIVHIHVSSAMFS